MIFFIVVSLRYNMGTYQSVKIYQSLTNVKMLHSKTEKTKVIVYVTITHFYRFNKN